MMDDILKQLYYGEIIPFERKVSDDKEYMEVIGKLRVEEEYFAGKLSNEDFRRLKDLEDLYGQLNKIDGADLFAQSFKLGLKLMIEVFS